jgi:hypothetical protein
MVLKVIDTRGGFGFEGPAGSLPMELAVRSKPAERKRLDLMVARSALSWAQAEVICGDPVTALADTIMRWRPDLIITTATLLLPGWVAAAVAHSSGVRPDVLTVNCGNSLSNLARAILPQTMLQSRRGEALS